MSSPLTFTGERFVPGASGAQGEMWYEHWHRYHYVLPFVAGRRVLDVACGEGYGSALMSTRAAQVAGVDISADAIVHGRRVYADRANLNLQEASCTALPFEAGAFDVVVSFETIEHIHAQAEFLDEVKRVLKPGGLFILSCPNKAEYSDKRGYQNEFHVKELYRPELEALLSPRFPAVRWLSQRNAFASIIAPEESASSGESLTVSQAAPTAPAPPLPALYYLLFAAESPATLNALPLGVSAFTDTEEWAYNDYRNTYKGFRHYLQQTQELEARCARLQAELDACTSAATAPTTPAIPAPPAVEPWLVRLARRLAG